MKISLYINISCPNSCEFFIMDDVGLDEVLLDIYSYEKVFSCVGNRIRLKKIFPGIDSYEV